MVRTHGKKQLGLFKEYLHDPELTHEAYHDGIYHTGDVAWRDEDGYFWFVGRTDDVIKSSGYRIGPFEVESALMTHPAVVECAITGVPDDIRGQVVKATIVLAKDYLEYEKREARKRDTGSCKACDGTLQASAHSGICGGTAQDNKWKNTPSSHSRQQSG